MASLPPGMNCKHRIKKYNCKGKGLYSWITSHTHRCDKNTNFFQHYINPTTQFKTASGLVEGRGANPSQNPPHPPPLPQKSSDFGHFEIGFFRGRIFFSFSFLFTPEISRATQFGVAGHKWPAGQLLVIPVL